MNTKAELVVEAPTPTKTRLYLLSALAKDGQEAISQLTDAITQAGLKVEKVENLGLKRLAFAIDKQKELTLVSLFFRSDSLALKSLEVELKHIESVARYLLTDWKADLDAPKRRSRYDEAKKEQTQ